MVMLAGASPEQCSAVSGRSLDPVGIELVLSPIRHAQRAVLGRITGVCRRNTPLGPDPLDVVDTPEHAVPLGGHCPKQQPRDRSRMRRGHANRQSTHDGTAGKGLEGRAAVVDTHRPAMVIQHGRWLTKGPDLDGRVAAAGLAVVNLDTLAYDSQTSSWPAGRGSRPGLVDDPPALAPAGMAKLRIRAIVTVATIGRRLIAGPP